MIKIQLIGHLGKNAILHEVNGKQVLNFSVAHNERYKNGQGVAQERTIWADCAMWAPNAVGAYLLQGTYVYVEGVPFLDMYTTQNGAPACALKVRVTNVQLLNHGPRLEGKPGGEGAPEGGLAAPVPEDVTEELPF
ncbi:single-stranded DNA-binding protein [Chitinophaga rhizosphaerae]|uniref:single-stranded DNA-binding protein n=1 Tax=Chitinophaga rhizosphaerae TaxID=1864947 RepID=UPI000F805FA6|nr:single-stranded DNA-binding protein [Chitinophaga rhizosphaerae]